MAEGSKKLTRTSFLLGKRQVNPAVLIVLDNLALAQMECWEGQGVDAEGGGWERGQRPVTDIGPSCWKWQQTC